MSLKLINPRKPLAQALLIGAAIICVVAGWLAARAFFLNTIATRLDTSQPGANIVVDWLTTSDASDAEAHLLAALYYERTFEVADRDRALLEYRKAAELSPNNYFLWLDLAMALSRNGDADEADVAFIRARELAPNYADVKWAYGNFLLRQGRAAEGFPLVAEAADADPRFAGQAVAIVLQVNDGDVSRARTILGEQPSIDVALAATLISLKRYDDALASWSLIPIELRRGMYRPNGETLRSGFLGAGQYRAAAIVTADLAGDDPLRPVVGEVSNGGFENGVKLRNAGPFEWQIADGSEPQIGLSETQKHSGGYGLYIAFNTFRPEGFRDISQIVPVEPGTRYKLQLWYRNTLKTVARFKWQLVIASTNSAVAATAELAPAADWTMITTSFEVPAETDGLKLQLVREGCGTAACPISGTLTFDDIKLVRE